MELINRDELLSALSACLSESSGDTPIIDSAIITIKKFVERMPAVDAVPVVRCADCKHYKEFRTKRNQRLIRVCYRMGGNEIEYGVKPNDFCSYGEKK